MPQLVTFALAEKCLITKEGVASLIAILQKVEVRPQATKNTEALPKNAVAPMNWCAYSLWQKEERDGDTEFSEVLQILWPDKTEFLRRYVRFRITDDKKHNVLVNISGFPVGQEGDVIVNMWLERQSQRIGEVRSWTIEVRHNLHDAAEQETPAVN